MDTNSAVDLKMFNASHAAEGEPERPIDGLAAGLGRDPERSAGPSTAGSVNLVASEGCATL